MNYIVHHHHAILSSLLTLYALTIALFEECGQVILVSNIVC